MYHTKTNPFSFEETIIFIQFDAEMQISFFLELESSFGLKLIYRTTQEENNVMKYFSFNTTYLIQFMKETILFQHKLLCRAKQFTLLTVLGTWSLKQFFLSQKGNKRLVTFTAYKGIYAIYFILAPIIKVPAMNFKHFKIKKEATLVRRSL